MRFAFTFYAVPKEKPAVPAGMRGPAQPTSRRYKRADRKARRKEMHAARRAMQKAIAASYNAALEQMREEGYDVSGLGARKLGILDRVGRVVPGLGDPSDTAGEEDRDAAPDKGGA